MSLTAGCSPPSDSKQNISTRSVAITNVGGVDRSYIVRLPAGWDGREKLPLVMLLHGATDSAAYAEEAYHFAEKGVAERFILVLPDAVGANHAWHGLMPDTPESPNNDLIFLTGLLDSLPRDYAVDTTRIFVCGHSSGAIMAYRLAAERPDVIAAAGIVAGTVADSSEEPPLSIPQPRGPVPLIVFHGKLDPTLPYDGATPGIASVAESIAFWAKADHCAATPTERERVAAGVERETFASPIHADIVLYTLDNGNHMWPGGKVMPGKTQEPSQAISATDLMWAFFKGHPHVAADRAR